MERAQCLAILLLFVASTLSAGCRPSRTASEVKELREGIHEMARHQEAAIARRQQVWADLQKRFDQDRDGKLNAQEESAMQAHLRKIKSGQTQSPFVVP